MPIRTVRSFALTLAACVFVSAGDARTPVEAAAKWTQLQSENFLFIGDASEGQIRRVAERLEQFREVLLHVLPRASGQSAVPTIVMVFDEDRSMNPVRPLFRGKPMEVAGFFQAADDVNYIVVNAEYLELAVPTIFHEYAHFLINENQGRVPVWVNEGLAELYATFERVDDDGRRVIIGRAPGHHLAVLKSSTMIPIKQLVAVDESASIYNEGIRRGVLYAQSWALVHYLTLGNPARAPQFRSYLSAMESGVAHEQAFAAAFGADAALLDRELMSYVRQVTFPAVRFEFREKSAAASIPRGKLLDEDEAETYLADIQARVDRVDEARNRIAAIQKRNPKSGRALMVLGTMHLREKRVSDAVADLEKAAALAPDDFMVQSAYGRSLAMQMSQAPAASAILLRARNALERATTINPRSARSAYLLGYAELAGGGDLAAAAQALERAVQLDPRGEHARLLLAQALVRQGEYEKATALLGRLIAVGRTTEMREDARRVLGDLATRRAALARATDAPVSALPPPDAARPEDGRRDGMRASGLMLRLIQAGEQRVLGTLDAIDCASGTVLLRVTSNGRALALKTQQLADVDFISYRSTAPGSVSCGPRHSRDRVYATYRPDTATTGIDGVPVAIELLPDDFVEPKPGR